VKQEINEVTPCLCTGEDGIGGVVVKPLHPRLGKGRADIEDVSVGPEGSTVGAVRAVVRLGSEGRRVVCRKAVPSGYLKGGRLQPT
jgi:hypothetical protein